jgi:uncharacterized membrane protein YkvA (DUF1232 family)
MALTEKLETWARALKLQVATLYYAIQDERTPLIAKAIGFFTVLYAISPIELIPDFIPVLGYLDDIIIVPVGVFVSIQFIPDHVWQNAKEIAHAKHGTGKLPKVRHLT